MYSEFLYLNFPKFAAKLQITIDSRTIEHLITEDKDRLAFLRKDI